MADDFLSFICRLAGNLGASTCWNLQGLSRPVEGFLYLFVKSLAQDMDRWRVLVNTVMNLRVP
jgi:hypothetical protein